MSSSKNDIVTKFVCSFVRLSFHVIFGVFTLCMSQGSFKGVSTKNVECFEGLFRVFHGHFKEF